jgi:hypothetical protein
MTEQDLVDLIDVFYGPGFGIDEATARFGPVVPSHLPDRMVLEPRDPALERAHLELLSGALAGISLRFVGTLPVRFAPLVAKLGPPREAVRMRPGDDIPHQFVIDTDAFEGYVTLGVEGRTDSDEKPVHTAILRRFPKAGQTS